jgi:nucleotidyltransferase substrate binding protein (TIGR01987 family)
MEKVEVLLALDRLKRAYSRLKEALERVQDELDRDGAIQRFEFTVELLWKTLKKFLAYEKVECRSPRDCIKKAFRHGFIGDDEILIDMLEDRNRSSHIYDEKEAEKIFERISKVYAPVIEKVIKKLEELE